ncbi:FimV/HubP family polar landmark protein [Kangiella sediminilitoris]|uniref:Tfp pilus assembly protein FimV-like protein n=1 Tax=Kangiella sediminilitoris TaxID=1144748 RepID=A0A1B3BA89_9GAMM|nr:FimV/HubP family polar landmark protein [Kangiella sediminilitoris]AOE49727.1 Tfp pilus assembly protein FimV-like protein [Kangiella sediminilitoris]
MFRKLAATVAVSTALITPSAWPLGLGDIDADSGLNQPLKAEITLLSSRNVSEEDLRAKLASYESYSKFGVRREAYHNTLIFDVITKEDGSKAILVESRDPIKEPFINFLVELNWAQGRLMREYTLLLDPPVFARTTPTPQPSETPVASPVAQSNVAQNKPFKPTEVDRKFDTPTEEQKTVEKKTEEPVTKASKEPAVTEETRKLASSTEFNDDNWTVERGQTLWSIAESVRPQGVSVQQTLLAIFHNNPEAFINNDINRVKAGAILTVPERSVISDVSQAAAINKIRSSTVSADAPLDVRKSVDETEEVESSDSQTGRLSIASVEESSTEQSGGSDLDSNSEEELSSDASSADSDLASTEGETSSDFESTLSDTGTDTESGVAVEDETLSVLSGAADKAEDVDESSVADESTGEPSETASATPEQSSNEEPAPKDVNSLEQNTKKAFYESENFWLYAGGGLLVVLLAGGGLLYRRNSRVEDDGGLLGMMSDSNNSDRQNEPESFLKGRGMKAPEEEADPLSQADILIARGKLRQAESLLEDALAAEPHNQEVRVKLMEVVASSQNTEKFNQLKAELPSDFDHDSALGLKVASLGSLLEEDDTEFRIDESTDFELPSEGDIFGDDESSSPSDLDLSEELESATSDVDTVKDVDDSEELLELDLSDFEKQVEDSASTETNSDDNSIEFTTGQDDEALVTHEDDSVSNDVLDNTANDDSGDGLSADDAATKFDLAKAYMELGDEEAARDILEEVKQEGNSSQRAEADKLLSQM